MRSNLGTELLSTSVGTNLSLRDLSSRAGFSTPDAMSEFYGYAVNRYSITATGNGFIRTATNSAAVNPSTRSAYSFGFWFSNNAPSKRNQNLMAIGNTQYGQSGYRRNDILMRYQASLNRIYVEVYNNGTLRLKREYPLHDYRNSPITGITSSSLGWYRFRRGNGTTSTGFQHLSVTVDLNQTTATNAIKFYWAGSELTYSVGNTNSGVYQGNWMYANKVAVGESLHQAAPSAGSWYGSFDNTWLYYGNAGSGIHSSIRNLGNISPMQYFNNNSLSPRHVWEWERSNIVQTGSTYSYTLNLGGTYSFS